MRSVYIIESIRTPRGKAKDSGGLHDINSFELLDYLYKYLSDAEILDKNKIDEIILGSVTQVNDQAGNIAKGSAMFSSFPDHTSGTTLNRFCSSSLDALNFGYLKIASGQSENILSGGIEMMSRVPMMSDNASIWKDRDISRKSNMFLMGSGADLIATLKKITRQEADEVAFNSQKKASHARKNGYFKSIISIFNKVKNVLCEKDECIRNNTTLDSLANLEPSFAELGKSGIDELQLKKFPQLREINHIHTPGNSPAMADAASITYLSKEKESSTSKYKARAKIISMTTVNDDPFLVLSGCKLATKKLLSENNLLVSDVDLFEIHEAFAATIIDAQRELDIPKEKLNVNGGVIALGHPMGATGTIMLSTLIDEMERQDLSIGVVSTSGAAGSGTAALIERI